MTETVRVLLSDPVLQRLSLRREQLWDGRPLTDSDWERSYRWVSAAVDDLKRVSALCKEGQTDEAVRQARETFDKVVQTRRAMVPRLQISEGMYQDAMTHRRFADANLAAPSAKGFRALTNTCEELEAMLQKIHVAGL